MNPGDVPEGVSYWKVNNGIRLTGMPSFKHILTEPEMWQVALLIVQADKPQSTAVAEVFAKANSLRTRSESEQMQEPVTVPAHTR